ncbi:MAG: XRE family transcriptional regulator [Candidatus Omnitrophota bacterium]
MKIGNRIHKLRKQKGMTLDELSRKSNVALATLSRMENNKMIGTLNSHQSICKALGVSISELYLELEEEKKVSEKIPQSKRTEHFACENKAKYELLVSNVQNRKIMPLLLKIDSKGETNNEKYSQGVEKFLYVINGTVLASVGKNSYTLKRGDSLYFDASLPHTFKNNGKTPVEAVCFLSPPEL